ncbi:MAG: class I SAM-dependent methyltransferase [Methanomicrobiales archaeon]
MLFLSENEKKQWAEFASAILKENISPGSFRGTVRENLGSAFHFYAGAFLAARGKNHEAVEWLRVGALNEEDGVFSSTFLLGFLERHKGKLIMPARVFEDPRPFIHFASVPMMMKARNNFIHQAGHTLPRFETPVSLMDIGCGDGALTVRFLTHLQEIGKINEIKEVLLIDPSEAMITLAKKTVAEAFPGVLISTENCRIQDFSGRIDHHYDIALSSLAYHHMPVEEKMIAISRLKPWINHFVLFELDANNDLPELFSPELSLSVYQSYGRIIDFVYAHDAPVDVVTDCVDSLLMTELVSLMTQQRGVRNDYHMLRNQWNDLFKSQLGPEFTIRCDSTAYADEYIALFTMHYGRGE